MVMECSVDASGDAQRRNGGGASRSPSTSRVPAAPIPLRARAGVWWLLGMGTSPRISVIIVSLNGRGRIAMPLDGLRRSDPQPHEVILVDNGSGDGLSDFVRANYPEVRLVTLPRNLGFAGGNNKGIEVATGDVLLLLNDDTEPRTDWLGPLEEEFRTQPQTGLAGCLLLYPDGVTIQHLGGVVHANGLTDHVEWGTTFDPASDPGPPREVPYATGAALAIRREVIEQIGLLDPGFWPIYFEEADFSARATRAGWKIRVVPRSILIHHESQTTQRFSPGYLMKYHRNRWRFLVKNLGVRGLWTAIRAEAHWWRTVNPLDHKSACRRAWAMAAVSLPYIWTRRALCRKW